MANIGCRPGKAYVTSPYKVIQKSQQGRSHSRSSRYNAAYKVGRSEGIIADWHMSLLLGLHVSLIFACKCSVVPHVEILHNPLDFICAPSCFSSSLEAVLYALFQLDDLGLVWVTDAPYYTFNNEV